MLVLRPVTESDHAELLALAQEAGIGMTSLPPDASVLSAKISRSEKSFSGLAEPHERGYLFVLMDTQAQRLVGTTGIVSHVGLTDPFYSYKLSTLVQASSEVGVYSEHRVLHMVNDYTGASEIGSLFLLPAYRREQNGRFLSRSRFLMMAEFPKLFSNKVISEIRGVQNEAGESPFYNHLARHFFKMEFQQADFINATQGGQFISDLMPKYPIYVNLLHADAQEVIGEPLRASLPAKRMLEFEGFRNEGYVDVFDGGPTMQAERARIRTVRQSRKLPVEALGTPKDATTYMLSNTRLDALRIARGAISVGVDGITLPAETAAALGVSLGDDVRFVRA